MRHKRTNPLGKPEHARTGEAGFFSSIASGLGNMDHQTYLLLDALDHKLDRVLAAIDFTWRITVSKLDDLEAEVSADATVTGSVITLINGLATQLTDLKASDPRIQAVIDSMRAQSTSLAAAVAANTPAAPTDTPPA